MAQATTSIGGLSKKYESGHARKDPTNKLDFLKHKLALKKKKELNLSLTRRFSSCSAYMTTPNHKTL